VIVAVVVLVLAAVAGVVGWWLAAGRYTSAPDVRGMTRAQAISTLRGGGYHVKFLSPTYSTAYKAGLVADEIHSSHVKHGATVELRLSLGGQPHQLSDYQGYSLDAVKADLAGWKIDLSKVKKVYSTVNKGLVVDTIPAAGQTVREGSSIVVEVSKGQQHVAVPDVSGQSQQDATDALTAKGFQVSPVQHYSSSVPSGTVITTHPTAGHKPVKGSTVTLVVSQGPRTFPVPDVEGENINQAVKDISDAGFTPKAVQTLPGGPGTVLHETPQGNQPKGTTIELDYY
jgi:serine/threonine-protein kinase